MAINTPNLFDWRYYLEKYPDLRANGVQTEQHALTHWHTFGENEGRVSIRTPNLFDWRYYLEKYPDLRANGVQTEQKTLMHWHTFGKKEQRVTISPIVSHIKQKNLCRTSYGKHMYSDLWYVCKKNKICITFTPRGGCSVSFQQFLDLNNLLADGLNYNSFIHNYRTNILVPNINICDIGELIKQKYIFVKFITNPYIRAVSIYRSQSSHNLSFREYLKVLIHNKISYFNDSDKYHYHPQYIDGEENIITKYVKIDKNETYQIKLFDNTLYTLDVSKYSSVHHGKKNINNTTFCGDLPKDIINNNLPKKYKYFYDDEIRKMVEIFYKKDIQHYGYSFDDF